MEKQQKMNEKCPMGRPNLKWGPKISYIRSKFCLRTFDFMYAYNASKAKTCPFSAPHVEVTIRRRALACMVANVTLRKRR